MSIAPTDIQNKHRLKFHLTDQDITAVIKKPWSLKNILQFRSRVSLNYKARLEIQKQHPPDL